MDEQFMHTFCVEYFVITNVFIFLWVCTKSGGDVVNLQDEENQKIKWFLEYGISK